VWEALLSITGSLLFGCASEPATGELYFKDDAGHVHQLTVTEPKQGAWDAAWQGDRFVAVIDRGFRNGLELRDLSTPPTEVGQRLGEGASPAVSPTGRLAHSHIGEREGRIVDLIVIRRGNHRRVVGYGYLIQQLYWLSRRRLVAAIESRSGRIALVDVTGSHRGHRVPLRGRVPGVPVISAQRRVAYPFGRRGARRIAVMRPDGSHRRVFRRDWIPYTWSPDGRRILVGHFSRVGLMNPRTGAVQRLGKLPCGYFTSAVWTRKGEHVWPPPR
jgi:hypothetical protein